MGEGIRAVGARRKSANEGGVGEGPIEQEAAENNSPERQGSIEMLGTIIDNRIS